MKKMILAALALLSLTTGLQSCLSGDNESHGTAIYNRLGSTTPSELYADQTVDSLFVVSYDSWTATLKPLDGGEWLEASPTSCKVPADYIVTQSVCLKTTPNNTGKVRTMAFLVNSSYTEYGTLTTYVYQYPWHQISAPVASFEKKEGSDDVTAVFATKLGAADTYAVLGCTVYAEATLESDANWLLVQNDDRVLKVGNHGIKFVVDPNNGREERVAHVTLTSNGVSTVITYTQSAKK